MHELEKQVDNNNKSCLLFWKYQKYRKYQKYHNIFAWKYHDTIMICIIDIYHWCFRANPVQDVLTTFWTPLWSVLDWYVRVMTGSRKAESLSKHCSSGDCRQRTRYQQASMLSFAVAENRNKISPAEKRCIKRRVFIIYLVLVADEAVAQWTSHFNVRLICALRQILNCLCHVLVFDLVKELSVQQLLAYGILYRQTSSELPLY